MQEIIVGTGNPAKVQTLQSALRSLDYVVRGIGDFGVSLSIVEDGVTAQENARKKSVAYAEVIGRLVLSQDSALYLDGLADDEQPGTHVRRVPDYDRRATDEELLAYYSRLISRFGGSVMGTWEIAICIADNQGMIFERTVASRGNFVSTPCEQIVSGAPLASIQVDSRSGKYIAEMIQAEQDEFWQKRLGVDFQEFVQSAYMELEGQTT